MEFSRPEHWSGLPFPYPGDLPNPGIEPRFPALEADSLPAEPQGKPSGKELTYQCRILKRCKFNSLGWEDPLATHSSILAWRIPGTEDPGGLRSIGSQRVRWK